jgi:nucleotide-binding universal stress UspA family protein
MFESILYATNFSESPMMLPCVGILGRTEKIHLLHVSGEDAAIDPELVKPQLSESKDFMDEELNRQRHRQVEIDMHLVKGEPARAICDVAKRVRSTIVISTHTGSEAGASTTQALIRDCDKDLLIMTRFASDVVNRSGAVDAYCERIFRRVLCVTDLSLECESRELAALRAVKEESSLGDVVIVSIKSDDEAMERQTRETEKLGVPVEGWALEGDPAREVLEAAEETNASVILFDGDRERDLALSVAKSSDMPLLVLKGG